MNYFKKFLIAFLAITGAVALATQFFGMSFGSSNFWDDHSVFFLLCIAFFPRLTLLAATSLGGGFFWWLGWIFSPRLLVAILATQAYWVKNPILVVLSWLVAVGGESSEKMIMVRHSGWQPRGARKSARWVDSEVSG